MKLQKITIQNFRGIKELKDFELKNLSLLVGENGCSKTSILEAINFCLSPYFLSGRIKHTDFYQGEDCEINISLEFDETFKAFLPDWYAKQEVECNKICLNIKKRNRATPNKAFSDIVVVSHYVLPNRPKDNDNGWEITRKTWTKFKFDERLLTFPLETEGLLKSFYFQKNRDKQIQKGFNSSISSVFEDFNWRFNKEIRTLEEKEDFEWEKFIIQKNNFEKYILEQIDEKSQEKTFETLNTKLKKVGLSEINLSLIDGNAPFDSAFLSQKFDSLDLSIWQIWSGIEMIVALMFLETMAEISKENILILIDEPELHLHPELQYNLIKHIISSFDTNQFLLSTHSPLFVKQTLSNDSDKIQIHCLKKEDKEIRVLELESRVLPYLSANEINYIAFGLPTEEYHNELYNEIENNFWNNPGNDFKILKTAWTYDIKDWRQIVFDNEFFNKQNKELIDSPFMTHQNKVTKHTYIRNKIHHSKDYWWSPTTQELEESIEKMRNLYNNSTICPTPTPPSLPPSPNTAPME